MKFNQSILDYIFLNWITHIHALVMNRLNRYYVISFSKLLGSWLRELLWELWRLCKWLVCLHIWSWLRDRCCLLCCLHVSIRLMCQNWILVGLWHWSGVSCHSSLPVWRFSYWWGCSCGYTSCCLTLCLKALDLNYLELLTMITSCSEFIEKKNFILILSFNLENKKIKGRRLSVLKWWV